MGLLDSNYDPWTGKKRKSTKKRDNGIIGAIKPINLGIGSNSTKKSNNASRKKLTSKERVYIWEHSKLYGRKCNICGQRINQLSDLELDHTRPYSNGGKKMNLTHRDCNRMKGSKSLKYVQKRMIFK